MQWGLVQPEKLPSSRRRRTLELTPVIREFNELAVPGLGGLWFVKQAALAALGVQVARDTMGHHRGNIEVANAIEALACLLAFEKREWAKDPRLRGNQKLRSVKDLSFNSMRRANAYVSQPMRMSVTEPLAALGLVKASGVRFSSFSPAPAGDDLIAAVFGGARPYKRSVTDHLAKWVRDGSNAEEVRTSPLIDALSPAAPVGATARATMRENLERGGRGADRRRACLDWVESLARDAYLDWSERPNQISVEHWDDMEAGAALLDARNQGVACLEAVESHLADLSDNRLDLTKPLPGDVSNALQDWRTKGTKFLACKSMARGGSDAAAFCRDANLDEIGALTALVLRDDDTLRRDGSHIVGTAAFRARFGDTAVDTHEVGDDNPDNETEMTEEGAETTPETGIRWPDAISQRIGQLWTLSLDLRGELEAHLANEITDVR
jgi:hypothetical protein